MTTREQVQNAKSMKQGISNTTEQLGLELNLDSSLALQDKTIIDL